MKAVSSTASHTVAFKQQHVQTLNTGDIINNRMTLCVY